MFAIKRRKRPAKPESPWMPEEELSLAYGDSVEATLTYKVTVDEHTLVGKKRMLVTLVSSGPGGVRVKIQRERDDRRAPTVLQVKS